MNNLAGFPGLGEFEVMYDQQQQQLADWRMRSTQDLDRLITDWDSATKGKTVPLDFAPDEETAKKEGIVSNYLHIANNGQEFQTAAEQDAARDAIAMERFQGRGFGDSVAFYGEIEKETQKRLGEVALMESVSTEAGKTALVKVGTGLTTSSWLKWREENKGKPGYDPAKEALYLEAWNKTAEEIKGRMEPFADTLPEAWKAIQDGKVNIPEVYDRLDPADRKDFMDALGALARTLPLEQQPAFWSNLQKSNFRQFTDSAQAIGRAIGEEFMPGQEMSVEQERWMKENAAFGDDVRTKEEKIRDRRNFDADIARIRDTAYDPIKALNESNGFLRTVEKGIYGMPGALYSSATAAIPYIGPAASFGQMEQMAYSDIRQSIIQAGGDDDTASAVGMTWAPVVAVPQTLLEKLGASAWLGKLPGVEKVLNAATSRVTNEFTRAAIRTGAAGVYETAIENTQAFIPALAQETAAALNKDVPGVVWKNGKDGFLDGYWEQTASTFVAMLPLSVIAGAGGRNIDARNQVIGDSTDTQLRAFLGTGQEGVDAIRAAQAEGPATMARVIEEQLAKRNPKSEDAKAAVAELQAEIEAKNAEVAEAQRSGAIPNFYRSGDSWTIFDGETGAEVGTAANADDALRLAQAHSAALDASNADQTAFLGTMLQAGEQTTQTEGTTFEFRPGEIEIPDIDEQQVLERTQAREGLDDAGQFSDIVLGRSSTEFKQRARSTANRINAGGSVLTVFHEETHGFLEEALAAGRITKDEVVSAVRSLDAALAGKTTKGGQSLQFLPAEGEVSDTQMREAVSELMESEILRNRKRSPGGRIPPGLISRNLTAMARLAPGAARKFGRFAETVRQFWGVAFGRSVAIQKAIREGKVNESDIEALTSKIFGLNQQDEHNSAAAEVASEITGQPAASFSLGPSEMASVLAANAAAKAKNPKAKASIMKNIADRLNKLRRESDQMVLAFGKQAVRPAVVEPRSIGDIREEANLRRTAANDLIDETMRGRDPEQITEAKRQERVKIDQWEREQIEEQKRDHSPKARLLRALAMLDGILAALPPDLRGRVGGHTQLARLGTDEKRLEYLQTRIDKAEQVIENYLKKEYGRLLDKLFERAKPAKDEAGKKRVGKAGADIHDLFATLTEARGWGDTAVQKHLAAIDAELNDPNKVPTPEREAHLMMEAGLVSLIGNWKDADSARRAAAVEEATRVFEAGYATFKLAKLMEREDRQIRRNNLKTATGKQGSQSERDARALADNGLKGGWKDNFLGLISFEQLSEYLFGRDSAEAIAIVDAERAASNRKEDATQAAMDGLEDLFTRLAGSPLAGTQLRWELSQKSITAVGISLSPLEAISATLMWRQEDGRRHMEGPKDDNGKPAGPWNYDQKFIDQIESQLSPEALAVRAYIAGEYAKEYDRLNPIYRQLHGINLPRNNNYAPLTVKPQQASAGQMIDPVTGMAVTGTSATPGSLRTRGNATAEPEFRDALQTFIAHTKQMEHWMAYAPFNADAGAMLRNRELGNAIEAKGGKEALQVMRAWLDFFNQGGARDAAAHLALNRTVNRIASRAAASALVGRLGVLAIQTTQLAAGLAEMPTGAFMSRFGKLLTGQLGWGKAFGSEYIQRRLKQMPPVVQQAMEGLRASEPNRLKHEVQRIGRLISGVDALMTSGTYAIVYDYQMKQAKELGLTGGAAESWAAQQAERAVDRVAQPTRPGTRSLFENTSSSSPAMRVLWAFASEARQKLVLALWRAADPSRPLGEKARAAAVTWVVGGMIATAIRSAWRDLRDDEDDEVFDERNWGLKRLILSSLTGPLQGLPFLGEAIEGGIYKLTGEYHQDSTMLEALPRAFAAASRVTDWGDSKPDQIMKDVDEILGGAAFGNDSLAAASSLMHLVRDLFGVVDNAAN